MKLITIEIIQIIAIAFFQVGVFSVLLNDPIFTLPTGPIKAAE
jgi:hypothetical protein